PFRAAITKSAGAWPTCVGYASTVSSNASAVYVQAPSWYALSGSDVSFTSTPGRSKIDATCSPETSPHTYGRRVPPCTTYGLTEVSMTGGEEQEAARSSPRPATARLTAAPGPSLCGTARGAASGGPLG